MPTRSRRSPRFALSTRHVPFAPLPEAGQHFELGEKQPFALGERSYSMTSSARPRSDCGTVRPSTFAVFTLTRSEYLVGR